MTLKDFGITLGNMYHNAPKGDKVSMIHLFGIKYAKEITESEYSVKDIVNQSGIPNTYFAEVGKGIRLAKFVKINDKTISH